MSFYIFTSTFCLVSSSLLSPVILVTTCQASLVSMVYGGKLMVTTLLVRAGKHTCVLWRRRLITSRGDRIMMTIMEMEMWLEICLMNVPFCLFSTIVSFVVPQVCFLFLPWFMDVVLCVLTAIDTLFYYKLKTGPIAVSFSEKGLMCSPSSNFCLDGFDTLKKCCRLISAKSV